MSGAGCLLFLLSPAPSSPFPGYDSLLQKWNRWKELYPRKSGERGRCRPELSLVGKLLPFYLPYLIRSNFIKTTYDISLDSSSFVLYSTCISCSFPPLVLPCHPFSNLKTTNWHAFWGERSGRGEGGEERNGTGGTAHGPQNKTEKRQFFVFLLVLFWWPLGVACSPISSLSFPSLSFCGTLVC